MFEVTSCSACSSATAQQSLRKAVQRGHSRAPSIARWWIDCAASRRRRPPRRAIRQTPQRGGRARCHRLHLPLQLPLSSPSWSQPPYRSAGSSGASPVSCGVRHTEAGYRHNNHTVATNATHCTCPPHRWDRAGCASTCERAQVSAGASTAAFSAGGAAGEAAAAVRRPTATLLHASRHGGSTLPPQALL